MAVLSALEDEGRRQSRCMARVSIKRLWRSLKHAVYVRKLTDDFKTERVIAAWFVVYSNSERPQAVWLRDSSCRRRRKVACGYDGQGLRLALEPTRQTPQAQLQQQDMADRVLTA